MAIRVAHVGTGNVGRLALTELITNPQFELTGLCVSSSEKVGRDAGELAASTSTRASAPSPTSTPCWPAKPDCVVYCAMGDTRLPEAMADVMRILTAGMQRRRVRHPGCCNTPGA